MATGGMPSPPASTATCWRGCPRRASRPPSIASATPRTRKRRSSRLVVRAILAGAPAFASYELGSDSTPVTAGTDATALAEAHATLRVESLKLLATVAEVDLDRSPRHAELGLVTMRELLNEWATHDLMHVVQAERAIMQAFIPSTGPWRPYFADHDVEVARTKGQE
jgi:hypothetical protein